MSNKVSGLSPCTTPHPTPPPIQGLPATGCCVCPASAAALKSTQTAPSSPRLISDAGSQRRRLARTRAPLAKRKERLPGSSPGRQCPSCIPGPPGQQQKGADPPWQAKEAGAAGYSAWRSDRLPASALDLGGLPNRQLGQALP